MFFAVFGDTHGHLRLAFQLARLWQREHGVHLDGIFQCGDLGYFPDPSVVDKATARYAARDPEEMGFWRYFLWPEPAERDPLLERTLEGPPDSLDTVRCPFIWCHGNHEDFRALEMDAGGSDLACVDAYDRLCLLRSGRVEILAGLRVAALGGGPEPAEGEGPGKSPHHPWMLVSRRAADELEAGPDFDVLLTHCRPYGIKDDPGEEGSPSIRRVVESRQPAYQFHAHHRKPTPDTTVGRTRCFWLNDVNFTRTKGKTAPRGAVEPGCMGVLEWRSADEHSFHRVDEPWFKSVHANNWQYF